MYRGGKIQNQIQKDIEYQKAKLKGHENALQVVLTDTNLVRPIPVMPTGDQCPKRCERWDGGNLSCRHHCGTSVYQTHEREKELRQHEINRHVKPIQSEIDSTKKEIERLELKSTLPYLRNELLSSVSEFQTLEKTDPQFRQKQMDLKKSIFEQSAKVDELENQFNWFANIPSLKPEIITPEPIVRTKTELGAINTRPLIIGGIVGLAALFLIWRFK